MADEMITSENLSKALLMSVFEAAFMDVSYDKDGDIKVKDQLSCFVFPNETRKDRIKLLAVFGFHPHVTQLQRLECVNKINSEYVMIRAFVGRSDTLRFDYDILVNDGISRKALVLTVKRFCSIPRQAILEYGADLVA